MYASGLRSEALHDETLDPRASCPREAWVSTTWTAAPSIDEVVDTRPATGHDGSVNRQRAEGRIAVRVEASAGVSRVARLSESGSTRLRTPRSEHGLDGVMLNIAGGLACGDRMEVLAEVGPGAELVLSTLGAERVYRSDGPDTTVRTTLSVEPGGRVCWAPQETILFDRARLVRRLEANVALDAGLTVYEAIAFGRQARGETVESGFLEDRWRVRRGGKLVFAETLRLAGPIQELLARRTVAGGATALATILHVAPNAERRLETIREALGAHDVEGGATAWNGLLIVRILGALTERVRDAARAVLPILIGRPLPRVWSC